MGADSKLEERRKARGIEGKRLDDPPQDNIGIGQIVLRDQRLVKPDQAFVVDVIVLEPFGETGLGDLERPTEDVSVPVIEISEGRALIEGACLREDLAREIRLRGGEELAAFF